MSTGAWRVDQIIVLLSAHSFRQGSASVERLNRWGYRWALAFCEVAVNSKFGLSREHQGEYRDCSSDITQNDISEIFVMVSGPVCDIAVKHSCRKSQHTNINLLGHASHMRGAAPTLAHEGG
jgi:hypothetical protein